MSGLRSLAKRDPAVRRLQGLTALAAGGTGFIGLFLVWPFGQLLGRGLGHGSSAITTVLSDGRIGRIAWFTVWQAVLSTVCVLALALPFAAVLSRSTFPGRRSVLAFSAAPFTLPTVVVGAAFLATLPASIRQGWFAIICAHVFFNLGMAVRTLTSASERLDSGPWEAARTLGASPFVAWRTVTLVQLRSTIGGIAGLVGTLCLTAFGVVLLLGGPSYATVDVEIYRQALQFLRVDRAAVLAAAQFIAIAAVLWYLATRPTLTTATRTRNRRGPAPLPAQIVAAMSLLALLGVPLIALVRRSLQRPDGGLGWVNFTNLARSTRGSGLVNAPLSSVATSLQNAAIAAIIAIVIASALSIVATRSGTASRRRLAELAGSLPLAVSAVALGLGMLLGFSSAPFEWRRLPFLLPCAQAVICIPFVMRTLVPALRRTPPNLTAAAETLGASPWRAWRTIDAALARAAAGLSLGLAFAVALGEFGATAFLARPLSPTMPVAIARLSGRPGAVVQGQAAALAVILGALTIAVVAIVEVSGRQSRRAVS